MELEWYHFAIAILGSTFAGGINTLAGNGSIITLSILTELLGLPGNMANGTNRIGVFTQSTAGAWVFYRNGRLDFSKSRYYILLTILGSIAGVIVATQISNEAFRNVFRFLMIVMLVVILVNPKRWIKPTENTTPQNWWILTPVYLALGFYGGFIQMGMGVVFLAVMVLYSKYKLLEANAVKAFVIAIYTFIVILIFHWQGLIDWKIGLLMAVGQTAGGYLMARIASISEKANIWAHRLLVVTVLLAIFKLFNLHTLFL
ncbi:MAG TPA: sulfite exporter TauE/SafE family protein [Saprospiraceae bacterium]|nr:sulfite exporter TauE/SafE family protein [Saprospiraceae bacterium]HMQ82896.1 sulfite exporter TauE/SafE family protein [Saprospiraceae bacterium]